MAESPRPTQAEFIALVREAFSFLESDYSFEYAGRCVVVRHHVEPFSCRYLRFPLILDIEGAHWGEYLRVSFRYEELFANLRDCLAVLGNSDAQAQMPAPGNQREVIPALARLMRDHLAPALTGDRDFFLRAMQEHHRHAATQAAEPSPDQTP